MLLYVYSLGDEELTYIDSCRSPDVDMLWNFIDAYNKGNAGHCVKYMTGWRNSVLRCLLCGVFP